MNEFSEFLNYDYITSFGGMLVIIVIMTQFSKGFIDDLFSKAQAVIKTKYLVLFWSFVLNAVAVYISSKGVTPEILITAFFNTFIIWFTARKAYESFMASDGNIVTLYSAGLGETEEPGEIDLFDGVI